MKKISLVLLLILLAIIHTKAQYRDYIDLSGQWQFSLDTANIGINERWYLSNLSESINLPGTTDLSKKGFLNKDTTTLHLSRVYKYMGAAWYRKKIVVPNNFYGKHINLFLERTKPTHVWIDSSFIGESKIMQSPQVYDISEYMTPGEHYITIRIDNSLKLTPYGNAHIYSDDTQTNWNGIIGKLFIEAAPKSYISNLQVYPDITKKKIDIEIEITNQLGLDNFEIELQVEKLLNGKSSPLKTQKLKTAYEPIIILEYALGDECSLWDEYEQPVYNLTVIISHEEIIDSKSVSFGMRHFTTNGTQFEINGRKTFLRGKHDAAVFPLSGHTPMEAEDWIRVFKIAKSYGINHYRFHSYCPPEAAFTAADQVGVYLQAELPFWGGLESDSVASMLLEEGIGMLKYYANHPSFVMFSPGNEIWSGHDRVEKNILALKQYDSRPLYTMGSNNNIGYATPGKHSDFFVAARTPSNGDTTLTHTRLTHAFVDSRNGGILNTQLPSTKMNYDFSVSQFSIPIVSHEIGQYQIYPDYEEIEKYTGVLRAWNFLIFKERLNKAGMLHQNMDFQKASGAWSAICYKAEMETALRTKGFGGFQLLDLQDFPGQGTALVGILDAFMESKNVISQKDWLQSCNDVVLLLEFPKYCWTNDEVFYAELSAVNYSNKSFNNELRWEVRNQKGIVLHKGNFINRSIVNGGSNIVGELNFELSKISKAEKLTINISLQDTPYNNSYPIWVYPKSTTIQTSADILISTKLDNEVFQKLNYGGKVLLLPQTDDIKDHSVAGLFPPDFWNYGMFKGISEWAKKPVSPGTLGILTDPNHPIFNSFPTEFHTNWQWFSMIKESNSLILDSITKEFKPIVQVIDNLERNHKLGLIFEFLVGKGRLLVCMVQLNTLTDKPEANQLYKSIVSYMNSDKFNPTFSITQSALSILLNYCE